MASESSSPESIFFAALEKPTAEEQAAYLDQACGADTKLRRRVDKLLSAQPHVGKFLEEPWTDLGDDSERESSQEGAGAVIGPYKLLQEIGEGGFGIVYMAEQLEPVRRHVALKIIKPGMDTRDVIARFEAERQALAMMDHSNIARILDAGATKSGRPYFVMELVKGVPITEFCDKNNFDTEKRLELFMTVCRAIQHAHQKGVIHRDIKPSNIMITLHDGDPVPKVIDFGISKAISQRLTEKTLFTRYGQMIGTPQYMSPEQAEMSGLDVDTRSDVYSLGVLLYELLTGTTPLEGEKLRTAGYAELVRMIQTEEPTKPSTRVSSLGDNQTVVCEQRSTDAKRLHQLFRGDLDWIVMKALEKHRDRRYQTASEFARDIERHLKDEPVLAGPPNAAYLLSKIVRRNKVAVVTASVVLAALIIGLVAALWGFVNANFHRGLAEDAKGVAVQQRDRAEIAEKQAIQQRDEAASATQLAEEAKQLADSQLQKVNRHVYLYHLENANRAIQANQFKLARQHLLDCKEQQRRWEWSLLESRTRFSELPGSEQPCFTNDGKYIVSIGFAGSLEDQGSVIIWNAATMAPVARLPPHDSRLISLALSSDDKWAVAGDTHGNLVLWDFDAREKKWTKKHHDKRFNGLAFSPDAKLIATANYDGFLKVVNVSDGEERFSIPLIRSNNQGNGADLPSLPAVAGHRSGGRKVMFSPDGRYLASGGELSVLVETASEKIIYEFPPYTEVPTFSPDGLQIATGNPVERSITLWDWDDKNKPTPRKTWQGDSSNRFHDLCFHSDGGQLVSAQGTHVSVWDITTTKRKMRLANIDTGHMTYWLALSPTDNVIACGCGSDREGTLWKYTGKDDSVNVVPLDMEPWLLEFSPDGKKIAIGSHRGQQGLSATVPEYSGPVVVLDSESGDCLCSIPRDCRGFCWMPNSQQIVITRDDENSHELYGCETADFVKEFAGDPNMGRPFVDQTGSQLKSVRFDGKNDRYVLQTWNMAANQQPDSVVFKAF